jgi:general secretion pathway protein G
MRAKTVQKRNAFTLVELLVVIAIIVILMALTVGVLSRVWAYMDEVKSTQEIAKLSESCQIFKSTFGRYPPARIVLSQVVDPGGPVPPPGSYRWGIQQGGTLGALFTYSSEYLGSIFSGIDLRLGHQWSGQPGNTYYVLDGSECLVYFLGGMRTGGPGGSAPLGFNTDKTNPTQVTGGARLGPFFNAFDEERIEWNSPNTGPAAGWPNTYRGSDGRFPVYKDQFGTPYAYFLARTPGTNNYWFPGAVQFGATAVADQQFFSDCFQSTRSKFSPNLDRSFVPFWQSVIPTPPTALVQYHKGDTFQIISAGKDKLFGCGGQYNQANPENSIFEYMNPIAPFVPGPPGIATEEERRAVFDNLSNVTNGRVVPQ